jgi:crotonobetainyl-CoA:carnitine CoA-transferase CaiB-like acyl-CoA transferase
MSGADHYHDEHFRARRSTWELDDTVYGPMVDYGPAPKLSATPARHKWAGKPVGWHNRHVLRTVLGLEDQAIAELEAAGVVGRWADRLGAKPPDEYAGGPLP